MEYGNCDNCAEGSYVKEKETEMRVCNSCGHRKYKHEAIPAYRHDIKPESILLEAEKIVNGDRDADYGDSSQNLDNIAAIAKAIGVDIDAIGVCKVMIAVKLGRLKYKYKRD